MGLPRVLLERANGQATTAGQDGSAALHMPTLQQRHSAPRTQRGCDVAGIFRRYWHEALRVMARQRRLCVFCKTQPRRRPRDYCSDACRDGAAALRPAPIVARGYTCKHCGNPFRPKNADRTTFCSRACSYRYKAEHKDAKAAAKQQTKQAALATGCVDCRGPIARLNAKRCDECRKERARREARERHAVEAVALGRRNERICRDTKCNKLFRPDHGGRRFCSTECRDRTMRRQHKKKYGRNHRQRARIAGAYYEPVPLLAVFERDRWVCQICEVPTPKELMGTAQPNAPEIDHVRPTSLRGPHSWDNLQCACRACNIEKRNVGVFLYLRMLCAKRGTADVTTDDEFWQLFSEYELNPISQAQWDASALARYWIAKGLPPSALAWLDEEARRLAGRMRDSTSLGTPQLSTGRARLRGVTGRPLRWAQHMAQRAAVVKRLNASAMH